MPAPSIRPLNPDHQRLIDDLLRDPKTAMCPICGERGFWDNREGKKNPKSPDWKCKNKACVGATPMKRKDPYAVWLPEGYTDAPAAPSKRLQGPNDGPPAFHAEAGVPASPEGAGEGIPSKAWHQMDVDAAAQEVETQARKIALREAIETAYRFAYDAAYRIQTETAGDEGVQPTADSLQAGAATIVIQMEKRGAI